MIDKKEISLAKSLIEQYCERNSLTPVKQTYDELAEKLVDLCYSLGGHGSEKILSKMLPSFLTPYIKVRPRK